MNAPSSPVITRSLARTVDDMLLDAGETDARLRSALLSLGSLRSLPVPEPGAELAALLLSGPAHQLERHRLLRRHRGSVVGLAVIAGMGLGVTGVAATGSVPDGPASSSVQQMLADWSPAWTIAAAPFAVPQEAGIPVEPQAPGDGVPGDQAVEDGASAQADTPGSGAALPGNAGSGASQPGTAHQGSSGSAGKGKVTDGSASTPDDGGAAGNAAGGNAAGGNAGGTSAKDAGSGDAKEPAGKAGSDAAGGQDKAGKSGAVTPAVEEASSSLAKTGKTAAGNADAGRIWLNKFSR